MFRDKNLTASSVPDHSGRPRMPAVSSTSTMAPSSNPEIALDANLMIRPSSADARAVFNAIPSLQALEIGETATPPRIIVVGEQLSGKSSVLETLSGIRFAPDKDSHTRFATELVLRCASETAVKASIRFADHSPQTERGKAHQELFQESHFDKDTLPGIIERAGQLMGIREDGARFSKDILRVEVAGPTLCSLTLIDLPGLLKSAVDGHDADQERMVDELIESYLRQPENIILAVVTAGSPLASQAVLEKVKKHDPDTERTIGLISQPDLILANSSDEKLYLDLARDWQNMHKLALGWHVLLNSPQQNLPLKLTHEWQFFQAGASCSVTLKDCGVENLQIRLRKVLLEKMKKCLPGAIPGIEANLKTRQKTLEQLGKPRSSPGELRSFLLGIAEEFHLLARDAIEGRYSHPFFGDLHHDAVSMKLRAVLRNLNRAFAVTLSTKGARYEIEWDGEAGKPSEPNAGVSDHLELLLELYNITSPDTITEQDLESKIRLLALENQGVELTGVSNRDLVFKLFQLQAERWHDIAQFHLNQVLNLTKAFAEHLVGYLTRSDEHASDAILTGCVDPFFKEKKEALEIKLQELLLPYTSGYGLSFEREFYAKVSGKRKYGYATRLVGRLEEQHPQLFQSNNGQGVDRKTVLRTVINSEDPHSDEFGVGGLIEMMLAHYQMSMRTFIDNVINLAIESCLVRHIPDILTPRKVDDMSTESVNELATESREIREKRQKLEKEVHVLQEALRVCNAHKPRESTVLPPALSRLFQPSGLRGVASTSNMSSPVLAMENAATGKEREERALLITPQKPASHPTSASEASAGQNPYVTSSKKTRMTPLFGPVPGAIPLAGNLTNSTPRFVWTMPLEEYPSAAKKRKLEVDPGVSNPSPSFGLTTAHGDNDGIIFDLQFDKPRFEGLTYAGMENVPLVGVVEPSQANVFPTKGPHGSRGTYYLRILDISGQETLQGFSAHELRLKWLVSHGA